MKGPSALDYYLRVVGCPVRPACSLVPDHWDFLYRRLGTRYASRTARAVDAKRDPTGLAVRGRAT